LSRPSHGQQGVLRRLDRRDLMPKNAVTQGSSAESCRECSSLSGPAIREKYARQYRRPAAERPTCTVSFGLSVFEVRGGQAGMALRRLAATTRVKPAADNASDDVVPREKLGERLHRPTGAPPVATRGAATVQARGGARSGAGISARERTRRCSAARAMRLALTGAVMNRKSATRISCRLGSPRPKVK
jgi:hypothetical protein